MSGNSTSGIRLLEYKALNAHNGLFAFSTTRHGGCGTGNYASLNCTPYTGDDAENVRRNRELLLASLPQRPQDLVIPYQTHGVQTLVIDEEYLKADAKERAKMLQGIDALMTQERNICLCISTADCIPVLLYDRRHRVIAAIHAGWRGTVNRIVGRTLENMHTLYSTEGVDVTAAIGPGISLPAFEVGNEVYETFRTEGFSMEYISEWHPATHKWHIDLWAANQLQLLEAGIPDRQIETAGICTYTCHEEFFSARRLGIHSGRILSGIMLSHLLHDFMK